MGSGTPREEGAIWRMTRCGRRNPGEGARVVRVAHERDDMTPHRRPVCRGGGCRTDADRIRRSHSRARSKAQGQSNRSSSRRHGDAQRDPLGPRVPGASDGFDWNAPTIRVRHGEHHRHESAHSGKPQGRTKDHRIGGSLREKARGPIVMETPKRDRPEAGRPGHSASAASERCRGRKPQERRPTRSPGPR